MQAHPRPRGLAAKGAKTMADSVYLVTEIVGTSSQSWEDAVANAVRTGIAAMGMLK